jgi:hypothetical protein
MGLLQTTSGRLMMRRLLGLIVLLPFVAVSLPVPLPSGPNAGKDRSQPFPCQDRPCGCRSAKQCWQKCCCFTNAQKVAWAKQNRIAVPEEVLTAARREQRQATEIARKSCCSKMAPSIAIIPRRPPQNTLKIAADGRVPGLPERGDAKARTSQSQPAAKVVIGALAGQCQGQDWSLAIVPAWMMSNVTTPVPPVGPAVRIVLPHSEVADSLSHRPPVPPPRRTADQAASV